MTPAECVPSDRPVGTPETRAGRRATRSRKTYYTSITAAAEDQRFTMISNRFSALSEPTCCVQCIVYTYALV